MEGQTVTDLVSDVLLAAVALAMLVLAVEVSSLPKKLSKQVFTPLSAQEPTVKAVEPPKTSEYEDQMEDFLKRTGSELTESKPTKTSEVAKEVSKEAEKAEKPKVEETKKPKEEKPFSMEEFVHEA